MRLCILACLIGIVVMACPVAHAQADETDTLWSRTYGGSHQDWPGTVIQTSDGGFLQAATTFSFGARDGDIWLVKTDSNGDSLWSRTYGGKDWDGAYDVLQDADGGYLVAGGTSSFGAGGKDFWLLKTNALGDSLWSRTFGGLNEEEASFIIAADDGGYLLTGYTFSFGKGGGDVWLVKTDARGDSLWSRTFGGKEWDAARTVIRTDDGGYVLAGRTGSFGTGDFDYWLIKTNLEGDVLWSRTFGGKKGEGCNSAIQTSDGGYLLAGRAKSFGAGDYDMWLVKTDADGDSLWSRSLGGKDSEIATSVIQCYDGNYLVAGITRSFGAGETDMWLVKTSLDGDSLWSRTFGGPGWERAFAVLQTDSGQYLLSGATTSFGADSLDLWLVCLKGELQGAGSRVEIIPSHYALYPFVLKPFNPIKIIRFDLPVRCWVNLKVLNLAGEPVGGRRQVPLVDGWLEARTHKVTFDGSGLPSGIYLARITAGDFSAAQKLILLK